MTLPGPRITAWTGLLRHAARRYASSYEHLKESLPARRLPLLLDDLVPGPSHRLSASLSSFLPAEWLPASMQRDLPPPSPNLLLPLTHHLLYFNPAIPAEKLLADGTDPLQSPGHPFVRRMWAGGYLRVNPDPEAAITLDGQRWLCLEGIREVTIKGTGQQEKIFVGIERRIGKLARWHHSDEETIRRALWTTTEQEFGAASLIERRDIVFLQERTKTELQSLNKAAKPEHQQPSNRLQGSQTFGHTFVPTASLLFRYSALTFNAHAIHLDPNYCRVVEGHRNLLFHGPLSLTLLATMIQHHVHSTLSGQHVDSIEYRNIAPLYADEPVKLCGKELDTGRYQVWIETPEGRVAVKGVARSHQRQSSTA